MESFWSDLKYAARDFRQSPGFALIAVLTLALGIGANTAIFTVAKSVLLNPLSYPDSDRIMYVMESNPEGGLPRFSVAPLNYRDFHDQSRSFEALAAVSGDNFNLTGEGAQPERLSGRRVTGEFFDVLGVDPVHGRAINPDDDKVEAPKVVVLNHGFWQRRFGGDAGVVGRDLTLNGESHTVIGVMPPKFNVGRDLFVPMAVDYEETHRGAHYYGVLGRLAEGTTIEQARVDLETIAARLAAEYPDTNTGWTALVLPLQELMVEDFRPIVWVLLAAVGLVLLIACANVANLLLGRMAMREREVALRTALGAGRWRLVRQFLTESTLLALIGGGLGVLLAHRGTHFLVAMNADNIPRYYDVAVDGSVLAFAFVLSIATGLIFGLLPAWRGSRTDLNSCLKEGGRGQAGAADSRLRGALVLAEVAVAMVLLVGAGVLLKSLSRMLDVDPGFDASGALTARLDLPDAKYPEEAEQTAFYDRLYERLAGLPGVEGVGGVIPMPLTGRGFILTFWIEGTPIPEPNASPQSHIRVVNDGYFEAMGIPRLRGRTFTRGDDLEAAQVVVINERTAARYFPDGDPIGRRITFDDPEDKEITWMTIVGIVGDVHHDELAVAPDAEIYWTSAQRPMSATTVILRTAADPDLLAGPLRAELARIDPDLPLFDVRTLQNIVDESVAQPRFNGVLLGLFAAVALLLATIGVYGVISYSVTRRLREIGVRLALGAGRGQILGQVLRRGLGLMAAGIGIGLIVAFFAARVLATMVYDISPTDPATLATVALLLIAVGATACLLPALRATRVDPVIVLREE